MFALLHWFFSPYLLFPRDPLSDRVKACSPGSDRGRPPSSQVLQHAYATIVPKKSRLGGQQSDLIAWVVVGVTLGGLTSSIPCYRHVDNSLPHVLIVPASA